MKNKFGSRAGIASQQAEIDRLKAKIDALMLEHCPDEMTADQLDEWAHHQQPAESTEAKCPPQ